MEDSGGQLPDTGFVAQIVLNIINENFAYYSQQPRQSVISGALFKETLATMSWEGQITTVFDTESQTLLIINFRPNYAAEGLRLASYYRSCGNRDQQTHAERFFNYYGEQQRTLAAYQREHDNIKETIHEWNFREQQQRYESSVFRTS